MPSALPCSVRSRTCAFRSRSGSSGYRHRGYPSRRRPVSAVGCASPGVVIGGAGWRRPPPPRRRAERDTVERRDHASIPITGATDARVRARRRQAVPQRASRGWALLRVQIAEPACQIGHLVHETPACQATAPPSGRGCAAWCDRPALIDRASRRVGLMCDAVPVSAAETTGHGGSVWRAIRTRLRRPASSPPPAGVRVVAAFPSSSCMTRQTSAETGEESAVGLPAPGNMTASGSRRHRIHRRHLPTVGTQTGRRWPSPDLTVGGRIGHR
jgi:hypothetical protein